MDKNARIVYLREGKLGQVIWSMGLPAMIGMFVTAFYNMADAYFVSGLGSSQLAAVSVVFPLNQILIGIGLVFGTGAASYIARRLGAQDKVQADAAASTAVAGALSVGMMAMILGFAGLCPLLYLLGATDSMYPYAADYGQILLSGTLFSVFAVTMGNISIAQGQAKLSMAAMMTGTILNLLLDPFFIYTLQGGVAGAAYATVLSQAVSAGVFLWIILSGRSCVEFSWRIVAREGDLWREIIQIGISAFFIQLFVSLSIALTNYQAKVYGDEAVAAMGIVLRVMALGGFVVFGFMKGFQPVVGVNFGARQEQRVRRAIRLGLMGTTLFCGMFGLLVAGGASNIAAAFSLSSHSMKLLSTQVLQVNGVAFVLFGLQMVYSVAFLAMGNAAEGGLLSLARQGIFFFPAMLILPLIWGWDGIVYAQPAADIGATFLTGVLVWRRRRELPLW